MAQPPRYGDSEHNLLLKIADNFGVVANSGDSKNSILYKIADRTYQSAINPPSPSYDPDALAYVQASGATDIQNINAFVVGIKSLGLWNSMVCWPLRSSQNAGTGSTAYSLGGLGTYNGTLVNGPTWGSDGLLLSSTSKVTTSLAGWGVAPQSMFAVVKTNSDSLTGNIFLGGNTLLNARTFGIGAPIGQKTRAMLSNRAGTGSCVFTSDTAVPLNNFCGFSISQNSTSSADIFANNIQQGTQTNLNWNDGIAGLSTNVVDIPVLISSATYVPFAIFFPNISLTGNHSNIYSLYKSTLGQGLSLP
jgi:hypothetical protein